MAETSADRYTRAVFVDRGSCGSHRSALGLRNTWVWPVDSELLVTPIESRAHGLLNNGLGFVQCVADISQHYDDDANAVSRGSSLVISCSFGYPTLTLEPLSVLSLTSFQPIEYTANDVSG